MSTEVEWARLTGPEIRAIAARPDALAVLPIGSLGLVDKRPEVIAALAAAEILVHIGSREVNSKRAAPETKFALGADVD